MKIINKEKVTTDVCVGIICNKCGKTFSKNKIDPNSFGISEMESFEGINIQASFGYDSRHFGDQTKIEFSLCEECLYNLVQSFAVKPLSNEESIGLTKEESIGLTKEEANKKFKESEFLESCDDKN